MFGTVLLCEAVRSLRYASTTGLSCQLTGLVVLLAAAGLEQCAELLPPLPLPPLPVPGQTLLLHLPLQN